MLLGQRRRWIVHVQLSRGYGAFAFFSNFVIVVISLGIYWQLRRFVRGVRLCQVVRGRDSFHYLCAIKGLVFGPKVGVTEFLQAWHVEGHVEGHVEVHVILLGNAGSFMNWRSAWNPLDDN